MSMLERLEDFPEWAIPLVYFVVGALVLLVFVLVFMYGPERAETSHLHSGSGGEPVGQDCRN